MVLNQHSTQTVTNSPEKNKTQTITFIILILILSELFLITIGKIIYADKMKNSIKFLSG